MKILLRIILLILITDVYSVFSQNKSDLVYVDDNGNLKWTETNNNAYFFGVNYSVPFAFSYRVIKNKNLSHKDVIDLDVQQFKRLGMNAYRIHVWDREVSDKDGNLLNNEHIELLDYLISKLIENDIYIILTPIAWWGTGWPEPDIETSGFSSYYSKLESTTKPEVLAAHQNYLKQFLNHKNIYTGNTFSTEEKIIAYEVFNEPVLPKNAAAINNYVNSTVKVFKDNGITKPIFFNISENPDSVCWKGVASSDIDGVSFQWYPTGLVKYSELKGNFIPNVWDYKIPNYTDMLSDKAKIVYEFDAADIGSSVMYPLMANSFRLAGMQWATMFCYDPTPIAQYNSEYSTHYLNLLYTPKKVLGFLIASKLFTEETVEEKKIDESSIAFNNAVINYDKDLAVLNDGENFIYTNSNNITALNEKLLQHIAGYGNSNLIKYEGKGIYFLDKIEKDLWQLEVYPDAVWIKDPFGKNGVNEPVAKLIWKKHKMKINLKELQLNFSLFSEDGTKIIDADSFGVLLQPGRYFLSNKSTLDVAINKKNKIDFDLIKNFGSFISDFTQTELKNLTPQTIQENQAAKIKAKVYSNENDINMFVYLKRETWRDYQKEKMIAVDDFNYEFDLPEDLLKNGQINYFISIEKDNNTLTFPGKINQLPNDWDFNQTDYYNIKILPDTNEKIVYDPIKDKNNLIVSNIWQFTDYHIDYTYDHNQNSELSILVNKIKVSFPELAFQIYVGGSLKESDIIKETKIKVEIKNINNRIKSLPVRFLFNDGSASSTEIILTNNYQTYELAIPEPDNTKYALLPRPYPTFLSYWFLSNGVKPNSKKLKLESIQFAIPLDKIDVNLNDGIKIKPIKIITK